MADITIPSWLAAAASSCWIIFVSIKTTNLIAFKVLQEKGKKSIFSDQIWNIFVRYTLEWVH